MKYCITIPRTATTFDMDLDSEFPADKHYLRGNYESEVVDVLLRALKPGSVAVDVGANVGYLTCIMAALVGPTGKVYAFEPYAPNRAKLRNNIVLNSFDHVIVEERPVWSEARMMPFYPSLDDSGGSALWNPALWPGNVKTQAWGQADPVETTTLAEAVPEVPDLIKIDAEGAELDILKGARLVPWCHPPIVCEINPFGMAQLGTDPVALREYLDNLGYYMHILQPDGSLPKYVPHYTVARFMHITNVLFATGLSWLWAEETVDFRPPEDRA